LLKDTGHRGKQNLLKCQLKQSYLEKGRLSPTGEAARVDRIGVSTTIGSKMSPPGVLAATLKLTVIS